MNPADTDCPVCGHRTLEIEMRMRVNGPANVAGEQVKMAGRFWPVIFCRRESCTFERWGHIEGAHAVFIVPEAADL